MSQGEAGTHSAGMTKLTPEELLVRGRDREALEGMTAALRDMRWQAATATTIKEEGMDGVQQLDEVIPLLRGVVGGLTAAQYDDPTPCTAFSVQGVLEHMIGGATMFAPAFRGEPSPQPVPSHGDTLERWQIAITELQAAVHAPGARERIIASPFGPLPGEVFARYVAFDGLMHAWDLSRATRTPLTAAPNLVSAVDAYARGLIVAEMRDGDTFAAETQVTEGATDLDRLAAFSGRTTT